MFKSTVMGKHQKSGMFITIIGTNLMDIICLVT